MENGKMNHLGTVTIETKRLILRRFVETDAVAAFYNWENDEKVTEFLRWPAKESIEDARSILNEWIDHYKNKDFYQWAIVLKENGDEPIGTISVVDQNDQLNIVHIGYCIGRKWWNLGITSEAFSGIIPFLFDEVKVNRIESQHDPRNPNSGKVMMKCGLQYEGTLRQADFSNQGLVDAAMYSLLADEYYAKK
jgi:Acetyltransferases, including N-acetylases of ribosomal proteins